MPEVLTRKRLATGDKLKPLARNITLARAQQASAEPDGDEPATTVSSVPGLDTTARTLGIYAVLPSNRYIPHRVSVLIEHLARVLSP